jgi:SpoIID/LytB domain protein
MSQNGANILAKQGYSYADILKYYYTGIEVR